MKRSLIEERTIFLSISGSQAYGLATPESDIDYKGCFVAEPRHYLGLSTTEQKDKGWNIPDVDPPSLYPFLTNTDTTIYEVKKFIHLLLNNNPSLLEILYLDRDKYVYLDPIFEPIINNRDLFLSKKVRHSFAGFAHSQLRKVLTHRKWLFNPPKAPPIASEYGLTQDRPALTKSEEGAFLEYLHALIQDQLNTIQDIDELRDMLREKIDIKGAIKQRPISESIYPYTQKFTNSSDSFMTLLQATQKYKADLDHWNNYQSWKKNRNKERGAIEAKCGYDGKNSSHLIRLLKMGVETLRDKTIHVDRSKVGDRDYLLAIKKGLIPYDEIIAEADALLDQLDVDNPSGLYRTSSLRHKPDVAMAEKLCIDVISNYL